MRRLLITGGGMLAGAVARACPGAVTLPQRELDVTDAAAVAAAVRAEAPDAIVNCAAYTDVDGAEANSDQAFAVNAEGARNVAAAAGEALVIYPSTDYVFDGGKGSPYVESDEPAPLSAYGRSKLAGERATAEAAARHLIVRTSWLFGVGGRNFVETMLALGGERDRVRVVDDQVGCPTSTDDLAAAIVALAEAGSTGIVHAAGSGSCSWYELAAAVMAAAGLDCRVDPCRTAEMARPAPRPAYSVLRSERSDAPVLPDWGAALDAYLTRRPQGGADPARAGSGVR